MIEDKMLLIRNYDLWSYLTDEEYEELGLVHNFIEARKGDIYFDSHLLNKLFFIKEGFIRQTDPEGTTVVLIGVKRTKHVLESFST